MDTSANPLVLTKIRVPAARTPAVARPRLLALLAAGIGKRVLLVGAPAGYGKTTLLAEWARTLAHGGTAAAWYALDPGDDDPSAFAAYLAATLADALGPDAGLEADPRIVRAAAGGDLQTVVEAVIRALVTDGRPCALILDDYHLIASPAIHTAVTFLADHIPDNLQLVLGSRSDPPLPLARLRARGQLAEIRSADLRFTPEETEAFLNEVMRLGLSREGVGTLEARTEGWIAGLQLAALSLAGKPDRERVVASFSGGNRYLVDYLLEEIVNRRPEAERRFLLASSILERLCAPLCDTLLGEGSSSAEILARLEKDNVFVVALDERGYWFRYHHLFREFLQTRLLREPPERVVGLHRTACAWLAAQGLLREAAQHAFQTGDWEYAAAFVEQYGLILITHGKMLGLDQWCSAFPEEILRRHPAIRILQCWGQVFRFRRENRPAVEARLRQAEESIAEMADSREAAGLREHADVVRSFLLMAPDPAADAREFLARGERMLEASRSQDASRFSAQLVIGYARLALHEAQAADEILATARQSALAGGLFYGVVESTFHLARLAQCRGDLRGAAELCRQGKDVLAGLLANPERDMPAINALDIALGCVLLEENRLEEAESRLRRGLETFSPGMNLHYLMTALVALAALEIICGRPEEAAAHLAQLESGWPDVSFCTDGLRLVSALRIAPEGPAALADAAAWLGGVSTILAEDAPAPGMGPFGAAEVFHTARLARIRLRIAIGETAPALAELGRLLPPAVANGLAGRVIALSLLEAQAAQAAGDDQRVWTALERAFAAGEPAGFIRSFDQGPAVARLLARAAERGIHPAYAARLISIFGTAKPPARSAGNRPAENKLLEELSERELEVLRLVVEGATNQAIADRLVITVGTAKSHLNHILRKLNAGNRTEAVARARKLGLV
jgi:LuxR family maltose regulon positive regulatory protein